MSKMPVFLINGFLGSGKTTLMLKLIKKLRENDLKVAVVLNELGQANLERHLFSEGNFFELLNGCICCSIQEDLKMVMAELTNLFKRKEADIAIIEGTGVANPSEIHEIFAQSPFSQNFQLQSSVCLADASMLQDYLSIYSSSKEVRNLQKQQIVHASHIVLNKIDLLEKNEQLEKVQKLVRKLNSAAMISKSTYGDCTDEIIQKSSYTIDLQRKTQIEPIQHREIKAVKLKLANLKIARTDINQMIKRLSADVIRAKGTIYDQKESRWYCFQYASGIMQWANVEKRTDSLSNEIIVIGKNLTKEKVLV